MFLMISSFLASTSPLFIFLKYKISSDCERGGGNDAEEPVLKNKNVNFAINDDKIYQYIFFPLCLKYMPVFSIVASKERKKL